jgi:hypothetical protein
MEGPSPSTGPAPHYARSGRPRSPPPLVLPPERRPPLLVRGPPGLELRRWWGRGSRSRSGHGLPPSEQAPALWPRGAQQEWTPGAADARRQSPASEVRRRWKKGPLQPGWDLAQGVPRQYLLHQPTSQSAGPWRATLLGAPPPQPLGA